MPAIPLRQRLIFALDVPEAAQALDWVERLSPETGFFKVGLELFVASGFTVVDALAARGLAVMLDLKFYDIPETVRRAVARLPGRGISFATVHGEPGIMRAAAKVKGDVRILAVTVLTSTGQAAPGGEDDGVLELVLARARQALECGCDGVVCSAREAAWVRRELGRDFLIVCPGIRSAGDAVGDQARTATPAAAMAAGVDHVVVGRPIRDAARPVEAAARIREEIRRALA